VTFPAGIWCSKRNQSEEVESLDNRWLKRRLELEKMLGVDVLLKGKEQEARSVNELEEELSKIESAVKECTKCRLHETRTQGVFARGRPDSGLMFIGEAPGADEDREGVPFVGRAGRLLDKMIQAMGLGRDEVYITNIVKSRPPENRDPRIDEIEACWPYLERQLELIKPEVIVTLGKPASNTLLDRDMAMGEMRGRWFRYGDIPVMATYHPAYLLRQPSQKSKVWGDLKEVLNALHGDGPPVVQDLL
jgi:DNA polymerase